jgi:segregation and condensation protein A
MEFTVKLERFEGPYTKLLELIESRKLSITEISLVSVADDYIAYIKTLDQKNLVDISQFIVVASTLMLMKAKSLLPGLVYTEEEEKQIEDLERKLELYALLNDAQRHTREIYLKTPLFGRPYKTNKDLTLFVPDPRVTKDLLLSIASMTLMTFTEPKALVKVAVEKALRMENIIESLLLRVQSAQSVSLRSLADGATTLQERKKLLIVNFIAILELLRSGSLAASQDAAGDIMISTVAS